MDHLVVFSPPPIIKTLERSFELIHNGLIPLYPFTAVLGNKMQVFFPSNKPNNKGAGPQLH